MTTNFSASQKIKGAFCTLLTQKKHTVFMFNSEYISNTGVMGEKPFNCSKCNRKFCNFF